MKKPIKINLFVSCPQNSEALNNQKVALAKMCNELEVDFAKGEKEVDINTVIYSVPENRKQIGEKNIKKADIAIFLFDDKQDDVLVNELKLTVDRSKKFREPELFVFFSKKAEENQDIEQIKQILVDGGWIPEPLTNTQKLLDNVKEKIHQYVRSQKSIQEIRRWSKLRYYGLLIGGIALTILIPLSIWLSIKLDKAESKRLLIVGGGSARAFIEDSLLNNINDTVSRNRKSLSDGYWLYTPMPSGDSYRVFAEEIINLNGSYKNRPYYPIVISSEKPNGDTLFRRTLEKTYFIKKGYVIGVHLGDDYLVAYGGNKAFDSVVYSGSTILETTLDSIIGIQSSLLLKNDSAFIPVYTTNKNSGTLNTYLDTLRSHHNGLKSYIKARDNKQVGWIALGSRWYYPKDKTMQRLTVLDNTNHKKITKQIYVYFILYKDNDSYKLPDATKDFLKKMRVDTAIINRIKVIKENDKTIINDNTVLYEFSND